MAGYSLTSEARDELIAGVNFYDSENHGLGQDFALEVRRLCRLIAESPLVGIELRPGVRRRMLRRFPYSILYTLENDEVLVIAVAHQRRRPGYWNRRL
jgi:plasmid stabilization system protein ParE